MRIGIYTNTLKDINLSATKNLLASLTQRKVDVCVDKELASLGAPAYKTAELIAKSDYLLVLGGDGTILNVIGECAARNVPIAGINIGRVGFLTEPRCHVKRNDGNCRR